MKVKATFRRQAIWNHDRSTRCEQHTPEYLPSHTGSEPACQPACCTSSEGARRLSSPTENEISTARTDTRGPASAPRAASALGARRERTTIVATERPGFYQRHAAHSGGDQSRSKIGHKASATAPPRNSTRLRGPPCACALRSFSCSGIMIRRGARGCACDSNELKRWAPRPCP